MVVEAQREGGLRECKENKPSNSTTGGREELCRIQSFTGIFLSLKLSESQCLMRLGNGSSVGEMFFALQE